MKTLEAMGTTDKCLLSVWDGETKLTDCNVTKAMVDAAGGGGGGYCMIRLPFTVPEESAGHQITFQVQLYDSNDFSLSQVSVNLLVDADAQAPADAQGVIDAIASLDIADADAIANARTAYEALDTIGKAWVGAELAAKLASYEQAQDSAKAVVDAIAALGDKDDLTDENYTDKTEALTAAEKLYNDFVRLYGEEDSAKLITNAQALTDYRTAYNAAEEAAKAKAKQAAIQNVEDLIEAIGEVNEDNYTEKEALIVAAETALRELQATYGDEAANEVRNKGDLEEAREKYDEIVAEPEVTYGDINGDTKIDASDALMALQHSVQIKTLEGDALVAADVSNDGKVDASDALLILQHSVNLIDHFPVEE